MQDNSKIIKENCMRWNWKKKIDQGEGDVPARKLAKNEASFYRQESSFCKLPS
jgi:hypothetical protein